MSPDDVHGVGGRVVGNVIHYIVVGDRRFQVFSSDGVYQIMVAGTVICAETREALRDQAVAVLSALRSAYVPYRSGY